MPSSEARRVIAVADASFLIGLCMIDHFYLLTHMVGQLFIAPAVWDEVVSRGRGRPGLEEVQKSTLIQKRDIENTLASQSLRLFLGRGEAESIVLAQEIPCDVLFVDELKARKAAQEAGIRTMGVAGFLLAAKLNGFVQELYPLLRELQSRGFRLSSAVIEAVLEEAGETPT